MRFPKGKQHMFVDVKFTRQLDAPVYAIEDLPRFTHKDLSLLEKLVSAGNYATDCKVSVLLLSVSNLSSKLTNYFFQTGFQAAT